MGTISKNTHKNGTVTFQVKCRRKGFPTQSKTFRDRKDAERWERATERAFDLGELPRAVDLHGILTHPTQ